MEIPSTSQRLRRVRKMDDETVEDDVFEDPPESFTQPACSATKSIDIVPNEFSGERWKLNSLSIHKGGVSDSEDTINYELLPTQSDNPTVNCSCFHTACGSVDLYPIAK
uniref:Uncharacterized protein n=1 Tax=Globodera rostochiensis TaxID=31243 RepID=A0A914H8I9_GLORO